VEHSVTVNSYSNNGITKNVFFINCNECVLIKF